MTIEDRIRQRAHEIFKSDSARTVVRELDDWLQAEDEVLAQELAKAAPAVASPYPQPSSYDQDDAWYDGETIAAMIRALAPRIRKRRKNSVLMRLIEDYQDYLTSSTPVTDAEAARHGSNALQIYRIAAALNVLLRGTLDDVSKHSVAKELKDLFSEDKISFETTAFNIVSAAAIQGATGLPVAFIGEGDDKSPDLRVNDLAYVECKDLHPASRAGVAQALADHLAKATEQLNTAHRADALTGGGICIDVPWGTLPLDPAEWQAVRDALLSPDGPAFVLVSCSGLRQTATDVSFPVLLALATKSSVPQDLHERLLRRLTLRSYRVASTGFDVINH